MLRVWLLDNLWTVKFLFKYYIWNRIPIGTKSVLFGAHCFFLHPWYVALAWSKLYGFPWDPRLWVAFFVHDIGYLGKPNMDGPEGERHVELGARIMHRLFDVWLGNSCYMDGTPVTDWHDFSLYHSRHYAKQAGAQPSRLCHADKLAFTYQIKPLYLWMTRLTGELDEYLENAKYWNTDGEYVKAGFITPGRWYDDLCRWIHNYVAEYKDGLKQDTITVDRRISGTRY